MAISYPLDWPTELGLNSFTLRTRNSVARSESPFSFVEQTYDWGGQLWEFSGTTPLMNRDTAEIYNSFLIKLNGRKGTFTLPIPNSETPRGSFAGTPVVDGAGQTGNTLNVRGFDPSEVDVAKVGDYIQIGTGLSTRLYKILDSVDSDTSGDAVLTIYPNLRSSPSDGQTIITSNCKGLFRLSSNISEININSNSFYSIQLSGIEAISGT